MNDEAAKAARAALHAGVVGAAALAVQVGDPKALAALAAGTLAEGVATFFELLASRNVDAIVEWRIEAMRDDFAKLTARVQKLEQELSEQGLQPDRIDPISREQAVSDFVRDLSSARTIMKREALVNAAANQHDPRISGASTRLFWARALSSLTDLQVFVVRLVAQHGNIAFIGGEAVTLKAAASLDEDGYQPVDLAGEDAATVEVVVNEMTGGDRIVPRILQVNHATNRMVSWRGVTYTASMALSFTPASQILALLIAD